MHHFTVFAVILDSCVNWDLPHFCEMAYEFCPATPRTLAAELQKGIGQKPVYGAAMEPSTNPQVFPSQLSSCKGTWVSFPVRPQLEEPNVLHPTLRGYPLVSYPLGRLQKLTKYSIASDQAPITRG